MTKALLPKHENHSSDPYHLYNCHVNMVPHPHQYIAEKETRNSMVS